MYNLFQLLYEEILLEALWDTNTFEYSDETYHFKSIIHQMYEMEYKLNALNTKPFGGNPQRLENIKKQIEHKLTYVTNDVKKIMLQTLNNWLKSHAILNPKTWAEARYNDNIDMGDFSVFESLVGEYGRYATDENKQKIPTPHSTYYTKLLFNAIEKNISKLPYTKKLLNNLFQQNLQYQYDEQPAEMMETWGVKTEKQAEKYIKTANIADYGIEYIAGDNENLMNIIEEHGDLPTFYIELYQKLVFPAWYGHWKARGIDETRANIENLYKNLNATNESNLGNLISWTNATLNSVHQNGSMLEYVEQSTGESDLNNYLDLLTNGNFNSKWDEELREIGVNI